MRIRALILAVAIAVAGLTAAPVPARAAPAPTVSPTPGAGRDARPSGGFVVLLVILVLGLVWQAQRTRRSTWEASRRALADLEKGTEPEPGRHDEPE